MASAVRGAVLVCDDCHRDLTIRLPADLPDEPASHEKALWRLALAAAWWHWQMEGYPSAMAGDLCTDCYINETREPF